MPHLQSPVLREGMWLMTQGSACVFVCVFFLLLSAFISCVLNSVL